MVCSRWRALGASALSRLAWFACAACGSTPEGTLVGAPGGTGGCPSRFATAVVSFTAGPGPTFGQDKLPGIVLGPPRGARPGEGSLDVATLGNGGSITLDFAPSNIIDGGGPDFIVFENPFYIDGDEQRPFAELATVEVSPNNRDFTAFPCTATAYPYGACAGWHPVYANPDSNSIDASDPSRAGGDSFDLHDVGVAEARYVRITDRVDLTGLNGSFDLDAASIVNAACP